MGKTAEILLIGSYHFAPFSELLKDKQPEILELTQFLANFNPTKIGVEWEKSEQAELETLFADKKRAFDMNEIEQIGFRLANQLGHEKVFAVNWGGRLTEEDMALLHHAVIEDYPEVLRTMQDNGAKSGGITPDESLLETYRKLNDQELVRETERMYLSFVEVENAGHNIGVSFLNKWMERELTIVKNTAELVEVPEERILLIIGADHLWMLQKLFEGKGWKVTNPFEKLSRPRVAST
ncbi:MAG: DUF5694 domain-containing protein [Bacillota bacterium]